MRQQSEKTSEEETTQKHLPSKIKDEEEAVEIFVLDWHNDTLWSLRGDFEECIYVLRRTELEIREEL